MDGGEGFVSMAEIFEEEEFDKNRVNIALPGFRVGVIYSYNAIVLAPAKRLTRFSPISAPSQRLLISMLSDTKFIQEYIETNKQRIQKMYHSFVDGFKQLEIGCIESGAG